MKWWQQPIQIQTAYMQCACKSLATMKLSRAVFVYKALFRKWWSWQTILDVSFVECQSIPTNIHYIKCINNGLAVKLYNILLKNGFTLRSISLLQSQQLTIIVNCSSKGSFLENIYIISCKSGITFLIILSLPSKL